MTHCLLRALLVGFGLSATFPCLLSAAPATPHQLPIQGIARDAADALIVSGDLAVRVFADSLGGTPVYDSGTDFAGALQLGVFDVVAGRGVPLVLDAEQAYFLELDVAGAEVVGDSAGGRWRFFPGGGSRARPDIEVRLANLEAAMGLVPAGAPDAPRDRSLATSATASGAFSSTHALLGLGRAQGTGAVHQAQGNLLVQPVGPRTADGIQVEFGPYYLFAPSPHPAIRFIRDVPSDQGRAVRVRWAADMRERPYSAADPLPRITGYTVYRRVDPGQAPAAQGGVVADGAAVMDLYPEVSRGEVTPMGAGRAGSHLDALQRPMARAGIEAFALPPGEWDVLTTIPATLDSTYQTVVPTLCDSNAIAFCRGTFLVRSITDQVGIFYNSAADSGYSVDNLAPGVPAGLVAQVVSGGTALSWQPSSAPDFQYFRIYRSADPDFVPGPATFVHATATTGWTDPATGSVTYKVTAVDFNGNESAPASATVTTSIEGGVPTILALATAAPNPFRHSLTFAVDVPVAAGVVELTVFDLAGRRVRTVARAVLPPGRHALMWDGRGGQGGRVAAGVYLARLTGAGRTITRRVTLLP